MDSIRTRILAVQLLVALFQLPVYATVAPVAPLSHVPKWWAVVADRHHALEVNVARTLNAQMGKGGLLLRTRTGATVQLNLIGVRQGHTFKNLIAQHLVLSRHKNRVIARHGAGVEEWYILNSAGLEQGITLARPLASGTQVEFEFALRSTLVPSRIGNEVIFCDHRGVIRMRYGLIKAYDARHNSLPISLHLKDNRLTLALSTSHARYPITIDPLFSITIHLVDADPIIGANYFGQSVALSADGKTALIGEPCDGETSICTGNAYLYHAENGSWPAVPSAIFETPPNSRDFGVSVALSADGTTALIGANSSMVEGLPDEGTAYIYSESGGKWNTAPTTVFVNPAVASDLASNNGGQDLYGSSVALNGNGTVALIGAPNRGNAYLYAKSAGGWIMSTTPIATLNDPNAGPLSGDFGGHVALSSAGDVALISSDVLQGSVNDGGYGAAYLYISSGGSWPSVPTVMIKDPGRNSNDRFASSLAISGDGNTAIIGSTFVIDGTSDTSAVFIYQATNGTWSTSPTKVIYAPSLTYQTNFGTSVALNSDGTEAVVGAPFTSSGGTVYVYKAVSGSWSNNPFASRTDPGDLSVDSAGAAVAISADGGTVLFGAPANFLSNSNYLVQSAYVFSDTVDLSQSVASQPASTTVGQQFDYTDTVENGDPDVTATGLTLTEKLAAGITPIALSADGGKCSWNGSAVVCTLASLAPGALWVPDITVSAAVIGDLPNEINLTAEEPLQAASAGHSSLNTVVSNPSGVTQPKAIDGTLSVTSGAIAYGTLIGSNPCSCGHPIFIITSQPTHGSLKLTSAANGTFSYQPTAGFIGNDQFAFQYSNGVASSGNYTESILIKNSSNSSISKTGGGGEISLCVVFAIAFGILGRRLVARRQ